MSWYGPLPFISVIDGVELAAVPQPDRTFEPHSPELTRRPGDDEQRSLEAPTRHRLRSQAVALAHHDGEERDGEVGADDEQATGVAHERGLLGVGPHHDPRGVTEEEDGNIERVAELHESGGLVGTVRFDRAGLVCRVVRHDPDRSPLDADQ